MIRVLHFIPGFSFGGIETVFINNFKAIDKVKIQLDVMVEDGLASKDSIENLRSIGCKVYIIPRFSIKNIKNYRNEIQKILFNEDTFDIIHSYNITRTPILFSIAKKVGISNRIFHARTNRAADGKLKQVLFRNFINYGAQQSTKLLACSQEAGDFFFNNKKFEVLNNGIDTQKYLFNSKIRNDLRTDMGLDESSFVVGHVGRFTEAKNHIFLLDIFKEFLEFKPDAFLLLVGDGPLKENILKKIETLNIKDKVIFSGSVNNVEDYYQLMDIFVFPSLYEGFGNVVIEAQASGLKVLASDTVPKSTQISSLVEFYSISKNEPKDWAKKINNISNYTRKNMLNVIIESGYDIRENADIQEKMYVDMAKK